MGGPRDEIVSFKSVSLQASAALKANVMKIFTNESSKSSDKGESSEPWGQQLQSTHLHDGWGGDGAPGGEESSKHDGDNDERPVLVTEGHGQGGHSTDTWISFKWVI